MEDKLTAIYLSDDEARIFIELRRIAIKNGWVRLNYKEGKVINTDEFRHNDSIKECVNKSR